MYKMMIIEDEYWIRKGLEVILPWEEFNIEIVGVARNGEEALKLLDSCHPDIIMTDIRMPNMDGITFIKKIRENEGFHPKIIILSGYDDFEYMKNAIVYGVKDYILKPVREEELKKTIVKVTEELEQDYKKSIESLKYMVGNYIYEFILNPHKNEAMEVHLPENYSFVVYSLNPIPLNNQAPSDDVQILDYNIGHANLYIFMFRTQEKAEDYVQKCLTPLKEQYIFGCSSILNLGNENFRKAYEESFFSLQKEYQAPSVFPTNTSYEVLFSSENESTLLSLLNSGESEKAKSYIIDLLEGSTTFTNKWILLFQIYMSLNKFIKDANFHINHKNFVYGFKSANDKEHIDFILKEFIFVLIDHIINEWNKNPSVTLKKIQEYIDENYSNPDLSLNMIADKFGFSPSYLSYIFKSEFNINFINYLTETRINKAKKLLKNSTDLVYEISEKVGFNDVKYFNRVFKQNTSLTPNQYRKRI